MPRLRPPDLEVVLRDGERVVVRGLMFDLDGTLVDSDASISRAWTTFAHRHGLDADAVLAGVAGRTAEAIIADHLVDPAAVRDEVSWIADEQERSVAGITAVPGAGPLLRSLPTASWAVVTSAPARVAAARIRAAGLPAAPVLVAAEQVTASKPDPEGFLRAARLLRVPARRCLVVEDSLAGVQAGRRSGATVMRVCGFAQGWPDDSGDEPVMSVADLSLVHAEERSTTVSGAAGGGYA